MAIDMVGPWKVPSIQVPEMAIDRHVVANLCVINITLTLFLSICLSTLLSIQSIQSIQSSQTVYKFQAHFEYTSQCANIIQDIPMYMVKDESKNYHPLTIQGTGGTFFSDFVGHLGCVVDPLSRSGYGCCKPLKYYSMVGIHVYYLQSIVAAVYD